MALKAFISDWRADISSFLSAKLFSRDLILEDELSVAVLVVLLSEDEVLPRRPEEGINSPVSGSSVPRYFLLGLDCFVTGS